MVAAHFLFQLVLFETLCSLSASVASKSVYKFTYVSGE